MKSFLLLVYVVLIGISTAEELNQRVLQKLEQQNCGVFKESDLSLKNNEVNVGSRPWMALIRIHIEAKKDSFACIGTLISDRYVLTVAHCVGEYEVKSVRLGAHNRTDDVDSKTLPSVQDIDVQKIIIHDQYKKHEPHNDIALLKLSRKVDFNEHIQPICLPLTSALQQKVESLESVLQTGWGLREDGEDVKTLQEERLQVVNRQNCSLGLHKKFKLEPSQFCSYMNGVLCRGSSGNPISQTVEFMNKQRFVQFGIVSFGFSGCTKSTLAIHTNVGSFMPWITRVLEETL